MMQIDLSSMFMGYFRQPCSKRLTHDLNVRGKATVLGYAWARDHGRPHDPFSLEAIDFRLGIQRRTTADNRGACREIAGYQADLVTHLESEGIQYNDRESRATLRFFQLPHRRAGRVRTGGRKNTLTAIMAGRTSFCSRKISSRIM